MAGVVTMELMVIFGMKLNFANIIALPLLLGLGVAFKIYYIMQRGGPVQTDLLQSSLTRAVFFSALTTATAFGSLWLSSHPGVEHGQADGARARHHDGGGGAVPAGADGAAARTGEARRGRTSPP